MGEITEQVQQIILDSIKEVPSRYPRVALCHSSGCLKSDITCQVCTHDKFEDYLFRDSIELISVLPSAAAVRRVLKRYKEEDFSFEAVFACHHSTDIIGVCIDLLGKFGTESKHIQKVEFLVELPEETLRDYETIAFLIHFRSRSDGNIKIKWKKPNEQQDEFMFPKYVLTHDHIDEMLNKSTGSLVCHSRKRNGCFDFEGGQNNAALSFKPGSATKNYKKDITYFLQKVQKLVGESPTGAVQCKRRVNWRLLKGSDIIERTVLICRHLDHQQLSKFATHLTKCSINFYFSAKNILVVDVGGIDASVLVRLMHCAEVPIPTTEVQGAFSFSIRDIGGCISDRRFLESTD